MLCFQNNIKLNQYKVKLGSYDFISINFLYILDCAHLPFETPEGVDVYYDDPYDGLPIPKGSRIFYKCSQGVFTDGKTWHIGTCKKDGCGEFNIQPLLGCTTEPVKTSSHGGSVSSDEDGAGKTVIKRSYQPGGM